MTAFLIGLAVTVALFLFLGWCVVVIACAIDAFAPEPDPAPYTFQRVYVVDNARRRRDATHQTGALCLTS